MTFKLNNLVEIVASTPKNFDHSVGYHDIKPFNEINDKLIALNRYPLNTLSHSDNLNIDICLWDYENSKIEKIDSSYAWSWEQGARLQWLNKNELIYNKIVDGEFVSCIYQINEKKSLHLSNPIYSISKKKNEFLNINFSRLWHLWKNYGYFLKKSKSFIEKKPLDDGVFLCDFNNEKKLVLSIGEAVKLCGLQNVDKPFFIAHPTFSPEGDKFVSLLRFFNDSGALISYFIVTNLDDLKSKVLARERVSHFEWINNNEIVVWSRNISNKLQKIRFNKYLEKYFISNLKKIVHKLSSKLQTKILSTHYHVINLDNLDQVKKLDQNNLTVDGHPQISEDGRFLVIDTYSNNLGYQKLMIHDLLKNKTHNIGEFKLSEYIPQNNLKYDLHPRWNKKGNLISIDSSHEGSRQSYVISIEKMLDEIK